MDPTSVGLLLLILLGCLSILALALWIGWRYSKRRHYHHSPYSNMPLRYTSDISYAALGKIYLYLSGLHEFDNRMFDVHRIAVCSETGRIFPDAVDRWGRTRLDFAFLQKRYPGSYVSWGSLSLRQQQAIREAHGSLEGFQTKHSSTEPSPRLVEREFAVIKPGPLYVDLHTMVLLGWKMVPGTELEVLIVQKPKRAVSMPSDAAKRRKSQ